MHTNAMSVDQKVSGHEELFFYPWEMGLVCNDCDGIWDEVSISLEWQSYVSNKAADLAYRFYLRR